MIVKGRGGEGACDGQENHSRGAKRLNTNVCTYEIIDNWQLCSETKILLI